MQTENEKVKELSKLLGHVERTLEVYEASERSRGNVRALAGLPPCKWNLPPDIETLYDLQWKLESELNYLLSGDSTIPTQDSENEPNTTYN
jgi:hypothetical protein